jgi:MerR family transcriptional regulator, copper efflux regulator
MPDTPLTVHEAAAATGWSARMLRYVEQLGLVEAPRSPSGYRLYGPAQLQRLRSLRSLLDEHGLELGAVAVALRLQREPAVRAAVDEWLEAVPAPPAAPGTPSPDWLAFEQTKHQHLLTSTSPTRTETA